MFELSEAACTVAYVNPRDETHDDEHVLAVDVGIKATMPNSILNLFDATLHEALYLPPDTAQESIEGVDPVSTVLRCDFLQPIRLRYKLQGRNVGIDSDSGLIRVDLMTCKLGKFAVEPKQGGSVELSFQVQCSGIDSALIGQLCGMLQQDVRVTVVQSQATNHDHGQSSR